MNAHLHETQHSRFLMAGPGPRTPDRGPAQPEQEPPSPDLPPIEEPDTRLPDEIPTPNPDERNPPAVFHSAA